MKRKPAEAARGAPPAGAAPIADRYGRPVLWLLVAAVVVTHVLGAGALRTPLWGANLYAFLPGLALPVALVLLAAAAWVASRPGLDRMLQLLPQPADRATAVTRLRAAAGIVGFFLLFWIFREGHTLLGDGSPLTRSLPMGQRFHPYQPLTFLVHHGFYSLAQGLFAAADARETARATVALSSALAGALFVPVAWALAAEVARALPPDPADAPARSRVLVPIVFLILLAQGYVQLYFGYVENYTFSALVTAAYLLASLRYLRRASPLALAGVALMLAIGLDLSCVLLGPSFLLLAGVGLAAPGLRRAAARDLAITVLAAMGITALMASVEPGYSVAVAAYRVVLQALLGHGDRAQSLAYMFSGEHVRDFFNEQMLIGPAGSFLFVAAIAVAVLVRIRPAAGAWFLLAAGVASLGGAWAATDLGLGYPRDWDLFAPSGVVFTTAALYVVLALPWQGARVRSWLFMLGCVSLFHTLPWIAVNTSFDRSFERFKTLPMGLGRTESAVGAAYLARADTLQAIEWFRRALDAYPANNVAAFRLGQICMRRGMYPEAGQAFSVALASRPDRADYRFALVDAVVRGAGPSEWARAHLDTLLNRNPGEPAYWACYGIVCLGQGEHDRARSAFERAERLAPSDSLLFGRLRADLSRPDGYARAVRDEWPGIAGD
jgi:hypothetical protein